MAIRSPAIHETLGWGRVESAVNRWQRLVGVDVRSLAALRIALASVLIYDILARARDLSAHYTDRGVLPRAELLAWKGDPSLFSVHLLGGSVWVQGLLFTLALGAALALLVGWRTRLATVLSWLLLASLHVRNPLVLHGGDQLLRVMLFWAMFVPWGRMASWDARSSSAPMGTAQTADGSTYVVSVATFALKLQLCGMYWISAALKWHPIWVQDGTAVEMALKLDQLSTPLGRTLTEYPDLLVWATHGTMVLETVGPALAWCPLWTAPLQCLAVILFAGFHLLGLAPALYLGIFPFVCAACWTIFLPDAFWDRWCPKALRTWAGPWRRFIMALPGRPTASVGLRRPRHRLGSYVVQAGLALLVVYVALWNLRTVDFARFEKILPVEANGIGQRLHLDQLWNLFAPYPATEDGWFVMVGTLVDGREVDARSGGPVSFDKPANVSRSLGNERWKKYLMNLDDRQNGLHRRHYGTYLCSRWNGENSGDRRLASIRMFIMRERTLPSGDEMEPRRGPLWNQVCVLIPES